jgi:hypothetical protein
MSVYEFDNTTTISANAMQINGVTVLAGTTAYVNNIQTTSGLLVVSDSAAPTNTINLAYANSRGTITANVGALSQNIEIVGSDSIFLTADTIKLNGTAATIATEAAGSDLILSPKGKVKTAAALSATSLQLSDVAALSASATSVYVGNCGIYGANSTIVGVGALSALASGSGGNTAIGYGAGSSNTSGSGNIYIGNGEVGAVESNTIRIGTACTSAFIGGMAATIGTANLVGVTSGGQLGTTMGAVLLNSTGGISLRGGTDVNTAVKVLSSNPSGLAQLGLAYDESAGRGRITSILQGTAFTPLELVTSQLMLSTTSANFAAAGTISTTSGDLTLSPYGKVTTSKVIDAAGFSIGGVGFLAQTGTNLALGSGAMIGITSGIKNTIIGETAGTSVTSGSGSIILGYGANSAYGNTIVMQTEGTGPTAANQIKLGFGATATTSTLIDGIYGVDPGASAACFITSGGQFGTVGDSVNFAANTLNFTGASTSITSSNRILVKSTFATQGIMLMGNSADMITQVVVVNSANTAKQLAFAYDGTTGVNRGKISALTQGVGYDDVEIMGNTGLYISAPNLRLNGTTATITTEASNANLVLAPNGTGKVTSAAPIDGAKFQIAGLDTLTKDGAGNLLIGNYAGVAATLTNCLVVQNGTSAGTVANASNQIRLGFGATASTSCFIDGVYGVGSSPVTGNVAMISAAGQLVTVAGTINIGTDVTGKTINIGASNDTVNISNSAQGINLLGTLNVKNASGVVLGPNGGGFTSSIVGTVASANRIYSLDDIANSSFVMTAGNQTVAGEKSFSNDMYVDGVFRMRQGANNVTLAIAPSTNRTYTLDDITNSSFVMTAGNQTIAGIKTFSNDVYVGGVFRMVQGANNVTLAIVPTVNRTYTLDDVPNSSFVMTAGTQTIGGVKSFSGLLTASGSIATNSITSIGTNDDITIDANGTGKINLTTVQNGGVSITSTTTTGFPLLIQNSYAPVDTTLPKIVVAGVYEVSSEQRPTFGANRKDYGDWSPMWLNWGATAGPTGVTIIGNAAASTATNSERLIVDGNTTVNGQIVTTAAGGVNFATPGINKHTITTAAASVGGSFDMVHYLPNNGLNSSNYLLARDSVFINICPFSVNAAASGSFLILGSVLYPGNTRLENLTTIRVIASYTADNTGTFEFKTMNNSGTNLGVVSHSAIVATSSNLSDIVSLDILPANVSNNAESLFFYVRGTGVTGTLIITGISILLLD